MNPSIKPTLTAVLLLTGAGTLTWFTYYVITNYIVQILGILGALFVVWSIFFSHKR
jgi:hypothetical protein